MVRILSIHMYLLVAVIYINFNLIIFQIYLYEMTRYNMIRPVILVM